MRKMLLLLALALGCDSPSTTGGPVACEEALTVFCDKLLVCAGIDFDGTHTFYTAEQCKAALLTDGVHDNGAPGMGLGCAYDDGKGYATCLEASQAIICGDESDIAAMRACDRPLP